METKRRIFFFGENSAAAAFRLQLLLSFGQQLMPEYSGNENLFPIRYLILCLLLQQQLLIFHAHRLPSKSSS